MALPQMNPLAAKLLGGVDYRKQLRQQLLVAAEKTDDPAYKQRLLEVADGKRPLRALMQDPAFLAERGMVGPVAEKELHEAMAGAEQPMGTPEEILARAQDELRARGLEVPSVEEGAALFEEVKHLQSESDAIVAADRLTGWGGSEERLAKEADTGTDPPSSSGLGPRRD